MERSEGTDAHPEKRRSVGLDGRRIYVAGGEVTTKDLVGAFRSVEAYDPLTNSWLTLPSMPMPRHGIAGAVIANRFHLVSGMMQSAGALTFLDPTLDAHGSARHSGTAVRCATAANSRCQELGRGAFAGCGNRCRRSGRPFPAVHDACRAAAAALSQAARRVSTRYNVNSPQGQVMLAKYAGDRDHAGTAGV